MQKKERNYTKYSVLLILASVLVLFVIFSLFNQEKEKKYEVNNTKLFANLQKANELHSQRNFTLAIKFYNDAIAEDPQNYDAYIGLGHSYLELGSFNDSLKAFEATKNLGYLDFRTYYGIGLLNYRLENYNEAYTNLKQAFELNPSSDAVVSYLINTYNAVGLYDEAIILAQNRLLNDSMNSHYYRKIAIAYFLKNDMQKALENAKRAVELDANYPPNQMVLGTVELSLSNKAEAISSFDKALALIKSGPVYEGLYLSHHISGNVDISNKNAVLSNRYGRNSNSLSLYGYSMLYLKDYQKAIEEFNKAIGAKPDYYLPYKGLGELFIELGQGEKAVEYLNKAIEINGLDEEGKMLLASLE